MTPPLELVKLVRERAGMTMSPHRLDDLASAIDRVMKRRKLEDPTAYAELVSSGALSLDELVDEVAVGETYFFREPDQFAFLRETVIPELTKRKPGQPIRAWSAGCSSGEEPYSLAMTFEEAGVASSILATDISRDALAEANRATYGRWSLRGPEAVRAERWLRDAVVDERIRKRVAFRSLNLATASFPSVATWAFDMDLIFCRNVLIYLEPPVVRRIAERLFASLSDGGWLFTASSDPPLSDLAPLVRVARHDVIAYRRETRQAADGGERRQPEPTPTSHVPSPRPLRKPLARAVPAPVTPPPTTLDAESPYLEALTKISERHDLEAIAALRKALYLDAGFVAAHLAMGLALSRQGDRTAAQRALRTVQRLCAALPPDAIVPHAGGTCAAQLGRVAAAEESRLAAKAGGR